MNILKKITGTEAVNKNLVLLLLIGGLYSLSIALSNTFVNIYLWRQSGEFRDIALYNLAIVVLQPLTFIMAGRFAKKIDRITVLRLGVIFLSLFYLSVLISGEHAAKFLLLLGSLLGIGYGFYWLGFNVLTFEITEPETRDFFNGFLGLLTSFSGMIGPILAGWIISKMVAFTGYTVIFSISLGLFITAVLLSMMIARRPAHGVYALKEVFQSRKNNKNWHNILRAHFFQGLREGCFIFVISVWVFITTSSELALGTYNLVHSAVAFVAYFLATRFIASHLRKKAIFIGGLLLYASVSLVIFNLTFTTLIIYAVAIAIAYPILLVPYISLTYDVIGKQPKAGERRIEYIVTRELYLNAGRIVSILMFLLFIALFSEQRGIPLLLAVIGSGHFWIYFFVKDIRDDAENAPAEQKNAGMPFADDEGSSTV